MRRFPLVLVLPAVLYVLIALWWQAERINPINGDEPRYLLMAESLLRDGDVRLLNNDEMETPVSRELPPGQHVVAGSGHVNGYVVHAIGVGLLVTPAYALGGVTGAKVFMAAACGLTALLVYALATRVLLSQRWAVLAALGVTLAQPFLAGSNQVYPDMLAGLGVFYVAVELFRLRQSDRPDLVWPRQALIALTLAFLPWLHIKVAAAMGLLSLGLAWQTWRLNKAAPDRRSWRLIGMVAVSIGVSLALLALYNRMAFGSPSGAWGSREVIRQDLTEALMVFAGLHLDRLEGLFIQAPLLWLGVFGVPAFAREDRGFAALLALVYLSLLAPGSLHGWYGGFSFAGRFMWAAALLWCFPLLFAMRQLLARRQARLLLGLLAMSAVWQAASASVVLTQPGYLYNRNLTAGDAWLRRSPAADLLGLGPADLARFFPSFRNNWADWHLPANWIGAGLGLALLYRGWRSLRRETRALSTLRGKNHVALDRNRLPLFGWAASTLLALVACAWPWSYAPAIMPVAYAGAVLPSQTGHVEDGARVVGAAEAGYVTYGPYVRLWRGTYAIQLQYVSEDDGGVFAWDCVVLPSGSSALVTLASGQLPAGRARAGSSAKPAPSVFATTCTVPPEHNLAEFQFRVYSAGGAGIAIYRLEITPLAPS